MLAARTNRVLKRWPHPANRSPLHPNLNRGVGHFKVLGKLTGPLKVLGKFTGS